MPRFFTVYMCKAEFNGFFQEKEKKENHSFSLYLLTSKVNSSLFSRLAWLRNAKSAWAPAPWHFLSNQPTRAAQPSLQSKVTLLWDLSPHFQSKYPKSRSFISCFLYLKARVMAQVISYLYVVVSWWTLDNTTAEWIIIPFTFYWFYTWILPHFSTKGLLETIIIN